MRITYRRVFVNAGWFSDTTSYAIVCFTKQRRSGKTYARVTNASLRRVLYHIQTQMDILRAECTVGDSREFIKNFANNPKAALILEAEDMLVEGF